jgi:hypothetical protein
MGMETPQGERNDDTEVHHPRPFFPHQKGHEVGTVLLRMHPHPTLALCCLSLSRSVSVSLFRQRDLNCRSVLLFSSPVAVVLETMFIRASVPLLVLSKIPFPLELLDSLSLSVLHRYRIRLPLDSYHAVVTSPMACLTV